MKAIPPTPCKRHVDSEESGIAVLSLSVLRSVFSYAGVFFAGLIDAEKIFNLKYSVIISSGKRRFGFSAVVNGKGNRIRTLGYEMRFLNRAVGLPVLME